MMRYLLIDTCDWIYLAKVFPEHLPTLVDLVDDGCVTLLLPERVRVEWQENKQEKIVDAQLQSFDEKVKAARDSRGRLHSYLSEEDADAWDALLDRLEARREQLQASALDTIDIVERLFDHPSTAGLPTTDDLKAQAADLALEKRTPFKNSMADGIIFLTALDHAINADIDEFLFVSSNKTDFATSSDRTDLHPDLQDLAGQTKITYLTSFAQALNEIEEGTISPETAEEVESYLETQSVWRVLERNRQVLEDAARGAAQVSAESRRFYDGLQSTVGAIDHQHAMLESTALKAMKAYEDYRRSYESTGAAAARAAKRNRQMLEDAARTAARVYEEASHLYEGLEAAARAGYQHRAMVESTALAAVKTYEHYRQSFDNAGAAAARAVRRNRQMLADAATAAATLYEESIQFYEGLQSSARAAICDYRMLESAALNAAKAYDNQRRFIENQPPVSGDSETASGSWAATDEDDESART